MHCRIGTALTTLAIVLAAGPLWAHHSQSAIFDVSKKLSVTGTLTKIDWRNPHTEISLDRKTDGGQVEAWMFEAAGPLWFVRNHITKSDFLNAIGQTVTVVGNRAKDGTLFGSLLKITFADGKSVAVDPTQ